MPKGISPIILLLIIASAFSQFGGNGTPGSVVHFTEGANGLVATASVANNKTSGVKTATTSPACSDLYPCISRSDVGPWTAACAYARAAEGDIQQAPVVAVDLSKPVGPQLPLIAQNPALLPPNALIPTRKVSPIDRWCFSHLGVTIQALIVTVPDPTNSHLVLDFDRRIDAIGAAALDAGFVKDQFWLPWGPLVSSVSETTQKNLAQILSQIRLNQPGLEVFRSRQSGESKALFVFLVAETPTSGVNLAQFENAISYVHEVETANRQSTTSEIKLLGPSFSGSIPALAVEIKRLTTSNCCLEIIPSSATDQYLLGVLTDSVSHHGTILSVLHDDRAALERFLDYAQSELKTPRDEVAVLSESQTAYGADENSLPDQVLLLTFPREIYRLRTAYPDEPHISAGNVNRESPPPQTGLILNLKSSGGGEDDVPYFSGEQLPMSQEAIMLAIADTINRRKIRLVGIRASDIFDTLFVLRFLRGFCPNARLFLLDSDLLVIRAVDNLGLQGTLAVTDYPLSPLLQSWQGNKNFPRAFPNRNSEVTYNGFLALINRRELMLDYTPEVAAKDGREPLLWLTVVSRNGFEPVHLLPPVPAEKVPIPFVEKPTPKPTFKEDPPTRGYLFLVFLLTGVTGAQIVFATLASRPKAPFLGWVLEYFHIYPNSPTKVQKAFVLATSFIILIVLDFMVCLPVWRITYAGFLQQIPTTWDLLVCALSALAVAGGLITSIWLSTVHEVFSFRRECVYLIIAWLVAACYYWVWFAITGDTTDDAKLFLHRSLDISGGTSPLIPHLLLFSCFYLWSLTNLRRIHLWESRRQTIAFAALDSQYRSRFSELEQNIDAYFGQLFFSNYSWLFLVLVLLTLLVSKPFTHIAGFEPFLVTLQVSRPLYVFQWNVFDVLYVSYLLLFTTFLTGSLIRFTVGWAALLKVLRRLERQPIRHAFDRLPKKFYSWTPLWHAGGARRTYSLQTREVECLRKLAALSQTPPVPPNLHQNLPGLVNQLQRSEWRLLDAEAQCYLDLQSENEIWQANLISTADNIAQEFLVPRWLGAGDSESIDQYEKDQAEEADSGRRHVFHNQPPPTDQDKIAVVAEEFVALRFVSFLRYVGVQLRNLLSFVVAGFIVAVASLRSYPFLAERTIAWGLTIVFIVLGTPVVIAFAQMDKDAILSRLSDTDPGKLDSAFYWRLISYGGLPLLTVLASQFPSIGRFLFSWIQPAIAAMH